MRTIRSKPVRAAIYARAFDRDKSHNRTDIARQVEHCRVLARLHNVIVESRHVFTDRDHSGAWPPTCWAAPDAGEVRPALSALITALEDGLVTRVLVHRLERLGSSSELLASLRELLEARDGYVIAPYEVAAAGADPAEKFALSVLGPRVLFDTEAERERRAKVKARNLEEIARLQAKMARLETEIAELDGP
jgi:DNA invertase Pin-like site-specific DNA recombinase